MNWLIVEDALRDRRGHWAEYVSTFVRGFTALGDEVVVLCDRRAEQFILEQTGARPVLPESIWHRMGDGAGALKRYARVPGHAIATFFLLRKFFRGFDRRGHRERRGGDFSHCGTESTALPAGLRPGSQTGASESDSLASELVDSPVSESLIRSADGPAEASVPPSTKNGYPRTDGPNYVPCSATETVPAWIFVPTVLVHHLLGWWLLLKSGSVPKKSRVLLFFPNLPIRLDDGGRPHWFGGPTTKLMAWLFWQLREEVESGRVVLGVETHAMRRALEGLIGMRVTYLPHPVEIRAEAWRRGGGIAAKKLTTEDTESTGDRFVQKQGAAWASQAGASESDSLASKLADSPVSESPTRFASIPATTLATNNPLPSTPAKPLVFGCYGAARWEKGSDIFQEAIKLILKNEVAGEKWRVTSDSRMVPAEVQGSGVGIAAKNLTTENTEEQFVHKQDFAWAGQAGASEADSLASELADSAVSESLTRSASIPAAQPDNSHSLLATASLSDATSDTSYPLLVTAAGRPLRFAIQWVEDFRDGEGNLVSMDSWLRAHPQVEVIGRYFEGYEYEQRLKETDVMVLPYRSPYRLRVSRVVIEAMMHGMPVIAPKGTTLFEQAEEYGVVLGCEEGSAESLAVAILEVAWVFTSMQEDAMRKADKAVESFSVRYFRELLQKIKFHERET